MLREDAGVIPRRKEAKKGRVLARSGQWPGWFAGQVPDSHGERQAGEEKGDRGLVAVEMPALPEGEDGRDEHDDAANGVGSHR